MIKELSIQEIKNITGRGVGFETSGSKIINAFVYSNSSLFIPAPLIEWVVTSVEKIPVSNGLIVFVLGFSFVTFSTLAIANGVICG